MICLGPALHDKMSNCIAKTPWHWDLRQLVNVKSPNQIQSSGLHCHLFMSQQARFIHRDKYNQLMSSPKTGFSDRGSTAMFSCPRKPVSCTRINTINWYQGSTQFSHLELMTMSSSQTGLSHRESTAIFSCPSKVCFTHQDISPSFDITDQSETVIGNPP